MGVSCRSKKSNATPKLSPRKTRSTVDILRSSTSNSLVYSRLSSHVLNKLDGYYRENQYPNFSDKLDIAKNLGVDVDKVANWFQNTRAKLKHSNSEPKITSTKTPTKKPRKNKKKKKDEAANNRESKDPLQWPMEVDGPIFQLNSGERNRDESSGVASVNDDLLEEIKKIKTSKEASKVCSDILDKFSVVPPITDEDLVEEELHRRVQVTMQY